MTRTTTLAIVFGVLALCACGSNITKCPEEQQHPVIFVAGLFFSMLDVHLTGIPETSPLPHDTCARENSKFETMWAKTKYLKSSNFDCITAYLKREFDPVTGESHNREGVEVEPTRFGSTYGVEKLDPDDYVGVTYMYHKMVKALKKRGFTQNHTLYGAPFDWRLFPTSSDWPARFAELVETAYANTGRKVVIVAHSMGCVMTHYLLVNMGSEWCQKYIEHWYPISPVWAGSPMAMYFTLTNGTSTMPQYLTPATDLFRDIEGMFYLSPKNQYGIDTPIATTDKNVYTPRNITDLFALLKIPHTTPVLKKAQSLWDSVAYKHPGIPTTVVYSLGVKTIAVTKFAKEEDVGTGIPTPTFTDGDGLVPKESLLEYANAWLQDEKYGSITDTYQVTGTGIYHGNTFKSDDVMNLLYKTICA